MKSERLIVGLEQCLTWPFLEVGTLPIEEFKLDEETEMRLKQLGINYGYMLLELSSKEISSIGNAIGIRSALLRVWHSHLSAGMQMPTEFSDQFLAGFHWTPLLQGTFLDVIAGIETVEGAKSLTAALLEHESDEPPEFVPETKPDPNARGRDFAAACMAKRADAEKGETLEEVPTLGYVELPTEEELQDMIVEIDEAGGVIRTSQGDFFSSDVRGYLRRLYQTRAMLQMMDRWRQHKVAQLAVAVLTSTEQPEIIEDKYGIPPRVLDGPPEDA